LYPVAGASPMGHRLGLKFGRLDGTTCRRKTCFPPGSRNCRRFPALRFEQFDDDVAFGGGELHAWQIIGLTSASRSLDSRSTSSGTRRSAAKLLALRARQLVGIGRNIQILLGLA